MTLVVVFSRMILSACERPGGKSPWPNQGLGMPTTRHSQGI